MIIPNIWENKKWQPNHQLKRRYQWERSGEIRWCCWDFSRSTWVDRVTINPTKKTKKNPNVQVNWDDRCVAGLHELHFLLKNIQFTTHQVHCACGRRSTMCDQSRSDSGLWHSLLEWPWFGRVTVYPDYPGLWRASIVFNHVMAYTVLYYGV